MQALEIEENPLHPMVGGAKQVVAVIPAYNEERFIASVVISARQYAQRVIVVDDGSHDGTALLARLAGAEVVQQPENAGKARAITAGFERALGYGPDAIVMLDADAQHNPAEIPAVVAPVLAGDADVVIGSRFLDVESDIPAWRQVGQHALTFLTNKASGKSLSDSQSGFRAFRPDVLRELRFESVGLSVESEMQFQMNKPSMRVAEVPITVQYLDGNKRNPVTHGIEVIESILGIVARRRPLLFFGVPGMFLIVLGALLGIAVVHVVDMHNPVPLGTVMLSTLLLLVGLLFTITGIILNTLDYLVMKLHDDLHSVLRRSS